VKDFVGARQLPQVMGHERRSVPFRLDPENPVSIGPIALPDYYFEFKRQQEEAMKNSLEVIREIHEEYAKTSGRSYGDGLTESYRLEDAETAIVCLGSTAGTVKSVVDGLRTNGVNAGLLRIRTFRPLPVKEIARTLESLKAVAVMDRSMSFGGHGGPVFQEIRHLLYEASEHPHVVNYIYGLGGRDTNPPQIQKIYEDLKRVIQTGKVENPVRYVDLRE